MRIDIGVRTDPGRVREVNQDSFLVHEPLFGVADGMGGHVAGDIASATAVEIVERAASDGAPGPAALERYIKDANAKIWEKARQDSHLQGMGTTFTLVSIDGATAHLGHVGDSRAYLLREGSLRQLTEDHTLVQRMVREGRLQQEEAAHHPQRSIITRALGVDADVQVDLSETDLRPGDRLLVCSDGLSSMIDDRHIEQILASDGSAQAVADRLVDAANEAGGEDNITALVLDIAEGDGARAGASAATAAERAPTTAPAADARTATPATPRPAPRDPDDAAPSERTARRGRSRALLITALVVALVVAGGYLAARWALGNSWFVGADEDGVVTIYQGIPEEIAGLSLRDAQETSDVQIEELPEFLQENVQAGIKVESLEDAQETVDDLEDRSNDFGRPGGSG